MSGVHGAGLVRWFGDRLGPLTAPTIASTPWQSATFAGTRCEIEFSAANEMSADILSECDIALGKGFVADIAASVVPTAGLYRYRIDALVVDQD